MNSESTFKREDFGKMTCLLMEDVLRCWNGLREATTKEDQDFWKRTFTRSVFAQIEGFAEYFRSQAFTAELNKLSSRVSSGDTFTLHPGLLSVLAGESFFITDDGEMRSQNMRTPFLAGLLFCFKRFAEAHGAHVSINKSDHWGRIQSAVRVRDGLTHPKGQKCLEIGEKEIGDVVFTLKWFYQHLYSIITKDGSENDFKEFPEDLFSLKLKKV